MNVHVDSVFLATCSTSPRIGWSALSRPSHSVSPARSECFSSAAICFRRQGLTRIHLGRHAHDTELRLSVKLTNTPLPANEWVPDLLPLVVDFVAICAIFSRGLRREEFSLSSTARQAECSRSHHVYVAVPYLVGGGVLVGKRLLRFCHFYLIGIRQR